MLRSASAARDVGAYLGLVPRRFQSGEIDYVGSISKCGDGRLLTPVVRGRQRDADALPRRARSQGMGAENCPTLNHEEGPCGAGPPVGDHHASHAPARHLIPSRLGAAETGRDELPRSAAQGRVWMTTPILSHAACAKGRRRFQPSRSTQLSPSSALEHAENAPLTH
jgi:hypothetical protein